MYKNIKNLGKIENIYNNNLYKQLKRQGLFVSKALVALVSSSILSMFLFGCQSTSKEERYNNMTPNEIYQQGVKNVHKKRYAFAAEDFEALESRYPFGEFADNAQLAAIYSYYKNKDFPTGLASVDRFIRMYPRHPHVDYAHYMKGLMHYTDSFGFYGKYLPINVAERDPQSAKKALAAFDLLTQQYPNSKYARDAAQRMVYLRNMVAEHELVAARFYVKRDAYVAAATRAQHILTHYDRSTAVEEALAILVQSYRALGIDSLANDNLRVLRTNYPNSEFLRALA